MAGSCLFIAALVLPSVCLAVSDEVRDFDLPAGPLDDTLLQIARHYNVIVSFQPKLVERRRAPSISGQFTLLQALNLATQPHGLVAQPTAGGAISIAVATPAAPDPGGPALPAATAPMAEPAGMAVLPRVEIFGAARQGDGLRALRASSATRIDAPLAELPQQVSVLTGEALALQGVQSSLESTRYIPGVVLTQGIEFGSSGPGGYGGQILSGVLVRGLNASVALSGMRTVRNLVPVDNAFIDRIEVAKGPTGVLTGISDLGGRGGVVNLVRKQAGPDVHKEVTQSVSLQDNGTLRAGADLGGELGAYMYWRLIGYGSETGRTEGGYERQAGAGVLGSLSHRRGDFTATLTLQADRQRIVPSPAGRGGIEQADGSLSPVEPGLAMPLDGSDRALASTADVELDLAWRLSPAWRATWKARLEAVSVDGRRHEAGRDFAQDLIAPRDAGMQAGLEHTLVAGSATHRLFMGLDLERWHYVETFRFPDGVDDTLAIDEVRQSLLLQDLMSVGPWRVRLAVQRGVVPKHVSRGQDGRESAFPPSTNWDAGVLYRWSPTTSFYAGSQYSAEWEDRPAALTLSDGSLAPYASLRQIQVGTKSDLLGGRLALTVEAFRLRESNLLHGIEGESLQSVPGTAVNGAELELTGRPTPALDLHLGLALMGGRTPSVFVPGVPSGPGAPLGWVPAASMRLLARHRLPERVLSNTRLGLAAMVNSSTRVYSFDQATGNPVLLRLPGGARIDLSLERTAGPWSLTASVTNVFDRQFYGTVSDPTSIIPVLPGRSAALMATFRD